MTLRKPAPGAISAGVLFATPESGAMRASSLRNEFHVGVGLETFDASFRTVAAFLDASEGRLRRGDRDAVDSDHACLQSVADRGRRRTGRGKSIGGKSIGQGIGAFDHFVEGLERDDRR